MGFKIKTVKLQELSQMGIRTKDINQSISKQIKIVNSLLKYNKEDSIGVEEMPQQLKVFFLAWFPVPKSGDSSFPLQQDWMHRSIHGYLHSSAQIHEHTCMCANIDTYNSKITKIFLRKQVSITCTLTMYQCEDSWGRGGNQSWGDGSVG